MCFVLGALHGVCSTRTQHTHTHTHSLTHTGFNYTAHISNVHSMSNLQTHDILHATFTHCAHAHSYTHAYVSTCVIGVMQGCTQPCTALSSCPAHLAGRSMAPLSCSVEAASAAQTTSHLQPPSWPSCPPLLPPGGVIIVLPQPRGRRHCV